MSQERGEQAGEHKAKRRYAEMDPNAWNWEFTRWTQRVLKAGIAGSVFSGALIVVGIATGNHTALEVGIYGEGISLSVTGPVAGLEKIEADVRKENNITPPEGYKSKIIFG